MRNELLDKHKESSEENLKTDNFAGGEGGRGNQRLQSSTDPSIQITTRNTIFFLQCANENYFNKLLPSTR